MTAKSAIPAVFAALYAVLNVSAITTLGCAVYDFVPVPPAYPYLRLQSPTENRLDTFGKAGKTLTVQAHVYANTGDTAAGSSQVQAILSAIAQLTNYVALNLTGSGFDLIFCRPEDAHDAGDEEVGGVILKHYIQLIRVEVMES